MDLEELSTFDFESKETWEQDWKTDDPEFHTNEVNAMLIKYHHEFTDGRNNLRILVPLCGKSLDMIWLADQGHSVVGVELVRKGIELFFSDNKLTYSEKQVSVNGPLNSETQGTVFKAREKDISLYECSIFDFSAEVAGGQFDCIWDRGSMTAINMMTEERTPSSTEMSRWPALNPTVDTFLNFLLLNPWKKCPHRLSLSRRKVSLIYLGKGARFDFSAKIRCQVM